MFAQLKIIVLRLVNLILLILVVGVSSFYAQEISIGNGDVVGCSGFLVDTGLSAGDYQPNEDITISICPQASETIINLDFFVFDLGTGDEMIIYDGSSTNDPLIGSYSGNELQGQNITSSNGCLTIHWTSDATDNGNFTISLTCGEPCIPPVATIEALDGQILGCPNEELVFDASASEFFNGADVDSFLWDFGDGFTDTESWPIAIHSFDEPGGYIVELYITDSNGCTSTNFVSLTVLIATAPVFNIEIDTLVCVGSISNYNASGNFEPVPWEQTYTGITGGAIFIPDDQTQVFSNSIDITGFSPLATIEEVNDLDFFFINFEHSYMGDLTIQFECPNGQSITVHQQGGGGTFLGEPVDDDSQPLVEGVGYDYWWAPDATNGTWEEESNLVNTLPSGYYQSVDPWENLLGCPINGVWTVQIADSWSSDNGYIFDWSIGFDPDLYPDLFNFTPSIGLDADSSYWELAPSVTNISDDGNELTISYTEAGTYEYTYVLVDNFGCSYSESYEVEVVQGPIADAGEDQTFCAEDGALEAQIFPGDAPFDNFVFDWTPALNLSDSSSLTSEVIDLASTTTYVLTTYPAGNMQCLSTDSVTINIMEIPNAGVPSEVTFCAEDDPVNLFEFVGGNPDEGGVWLDENENEVSSVFDPSVNQDFVFTYAFPSCEVFNELAVNVDQLLFVINNDTTICEHGSAQLSVEILEANDFDINYLWSNQVPDTNQFTVSPEVATTYDVSLLYGNGCTTDIQSTTVDFYANLSVGVTDPLAICPNDTVSIEQTFVTGGVAPYSFEWYEDNQLISTQGSFEISPSYDSEYCVVVNDQCESDAVTACTTVEVEQLLDPGFIATNLSGCFPITPSFQALQTDFSEVQSETWSFGDGLNEENSSSLVHVYSAPGDYSVIHTLISMNECFYESIEPLLIHAYPYPEASFHVNNEVQIIPNTTFLFRNDSKGNLNNSWIFYDEYENVLGNSDFEEPVFAFPDQEIGSYIASLTVENEYGCKDSTSQVVSVEDFTIFIPTAFTANNDGINDYFYVKGSNIDASSFSMTIYNRWGVKVFFTRDLNQKWDGSYNIGLSGNSTTSDGAVVRNDYYAQNEVYTYLIEVKSPSSSEIHLIKGEVLIIR